MRPFWSVNVITPASLLASQSEIARVYLTGASDPFLLGLSMLNSVCGCSIL